MNETDSEDYVENILHDEEQIPSESLYNNTVHYIGSHEKLLTMIPNSEKSSAIWTCSATLILLKLYETKLGLLETPKKKTRIWLAISESLKDYNIQMTADQVRWKINALTKKYKQSIHTGQSKKFKYFNEMDDIYAKFNVDCDTFPVGEFSHMKKDCTQNALNDLNKPIQMSCESKAMIALRKVRLANRIDSDRAQSKLKLEKQWLEYLNRQEQNRLLQDEIFDRNLKLRGETLELYRQELELRESMELRKLQLKEIEQDELLRLERDKCEMLKQFLENKDM